MTPQLEPRTGHSDYATARLQLSASQVAELARVKRAVVSTWRARFSDGANPFPLPQSDDRGGMLFDGDQIATWLVETGHGNNPEAIEDLSAFARAENVDLNNQDYVAIVEALLAYRAVSGRPLADHADHSISATSLTERAALADPSDHAFGSEIAARPMQVHWARYVDDLVESAFSPEGAWRRLQEMTAHQAIAGSAGELAETAADALARIVLALMPPETLDLALARGPLADARTVSRVLRAVPEHLDVSAAIPDFEEGAETASGPRQDARHLARYLLVHGEQANTEPSPASLFIARLRGSDAEAELAALEDLVIELDEWQSALVLGPATLLVDPLDGAAELARDAMLRSGRVRAIVRLPAGWVPAAVRHSLALWVIGGSQRDQGIGERISAIGDLRGPALTHASATDLASDISSVMGSPRLARRHAFKHLQVVRTAALLAGEGPLDARGVRPAVRGGTAVHGRGATELAVYIDDALARLPEPRLAVAATPGRPAANTTVGAQLQQGNLRMLQGVRIASEHCTSAASSDTSEGYPVVGANEVRSGTAGDRRIDRMLLVTAYPRAGLSEAGDVIFVSGSRPAAWVDPVGLSVVEYPARILRIVPESRARVPDGGNVQPTNSGEWLVPELVAADMAMARPGSPWRQCTLRRVPAEQSGPLSEALATLQTERMRLEQLAANIARAERLLIDGVASGVALHPRAASDSADLNHSFTTEGTH